MGLVASQARLLGLFARKSDLELRAEQIGASRELLAAQTSSFATDYANRLSNTADADGNVQNVYNGSQGNVQRLYTEDDAWATDMFNAQTAVVQGADKRLEMELRNVDTQQKAVQTEIDSVQKIIDKNIEKSFKYMS